MSDRASTLAPPSTSPAAHDTSQATVLDSLADLIADLLRSDPLRVLLGEDVRDGGMLGLSRQAMADAALEARVLATPLGSSGTVLHACGLARAGLRPIVLLPSATALIEALTGLRTVGAAAADGTDRAPVLFVTPSGPGFGMSLDAGSEASDAPETFLGTVPGLRMYSTGLAADLPASLASAAQFADHDGPALLAMPRAELLEGAPTEKASPQADTLEPVRTLRGGSSVTVFCWGSVVRATLDAAAGFDSEAVHICELTRLAPLDEAAIVEAAQKTGRIIIVHAGPRRLGLAPVLAALLADEAIASLDAPIVEVAGRRTRGAWDESAALPSETAIATAIANALNY